MNSPPPPGAFGRLGERTRRPRRVCRALRAARLVLDGATRPPVGWFRSAGHADRAGRAVPACGSGASLSCDLRRARRRAFCGRVVGGHRRCRGVDVARRRRFPPAPLRRAARRRQSAVVAGRQRRWSGAVRLPQRSDRRVGSAASDSGARSIRPSSTVRSSRAIARSSSLPVGRETMHGTRRCSPATSSPRRDSGRSRLIGHLHQRSMPRWTRHSPIRCAVSASGRLRSRRARGRRSRLPRLHLGRTRIRGHAARGIVPASQRLEAVHRRRRAGVARRRRRRSRHSATRRARRGHSAASRRDHRPAPAAASPCARLPRG